MAVTERLMGSGNFSLNFSQEFTPTEIIESISEWGHIVLTPQEIDVNTLSDSDILSISRYTGIVLNRQLEEGIVTINGTGLQLYLGDGNSKGMVIAESKNIGKVRTYTNTTLAETLFNSTVSTGKPYGIFRNESGNTQAITQGTIYEPASTYIGSHFVQTALGALKEVAEFLNVEYKINADGTLDAGPPANLFIGVNSNPSTIVVKTGYGEDPEFQGVVPQGLRTEFDATDWVSRVDFVGEVGYFDAATDVAGEANLSSNPYKDLHGNDLTRVALIQEPEVPTDQLNSRAQLMLTEMARVKKVLNLDLEQYEVSGDMKAGDYIFAFDPDIGFVDTSSEATAESRNLYEVTFRGQVITPIKVRVIGITFPITNGMGVYFRDKDGNYTDLTQYVQFESGSAQVELGDVIRFIGDDLRFSEFSLNAKTAGVFSIPDLPSTPTLQSGTYLNATGDSIGFIRLTVSKPTNTDSSQITDGSHYRVRYKKSTDNQYSYFNFPFTGASTESLLIQDLTVGFTYDVGVAVVDKSGFKSMSSYDGSGEDLYTNSSSINANYATNARIEIEKDGQAPSKPKTATIAAGPLRVQVTHYLGKDGTDGNGNPYGNFTLEGDVDHLDIHAVDQDGNVQDFTVNTANKIGEIRVTSGNLLQAIPVIGTIEVEDSVDKYFRIVAVDKSGNESDPSDGQSAGGNLIAEANIADATITSAKIGTAQITNAKIADATITSAKIHDLSADKITSGSIIGGEITVGGISNTSGFIKSYNYSSGSAGWQISPDGSAEFQNATIRGSLNASDISAGTINANFLPTITTSQINFTAGDIGGATSSDLDDYVEISALANGNLAITTSGAVQISGSLEVTGTITANAGFINGVAVEPSGVTSAITMDDLSSLISQLTASSGGTFRTASSGARVQISSASSTPIIEVFDSAGSVTGQIGYNSTADKIYMSGSSTPINFVTTSAETPAANNTQSRITLSANVIDFENSVGNGTPYIRIGDVTATNKYLTVDSSGKLAFSSQSVTGGVTSITAAGELSLSGAGTGDVTITHADSDHDDRFYTKSTNDILLATKAASSHSHSTSDISGGVDNYGSWTAKAGGNNMTVQSGYGVEWKAGSGISMSVNTSPYEITFSHGGGTHVDSSTAVQALFPGGLRGSVVIGAGTGFLTGATSNSSNQITVNGETTRSSATRMGHIFPNATSSALGFQSSGNYWYRLYAQLSTYVSSDERLKQEIIDIPYGLDYINTLEPKEYELIRKTVRGCDVCNTPVPEGDDCLQCDENEDTPNIIDNLDVTGEVVGKKHFGFLAQDLITTPPEPNKDIALVDYNSDSDTYAVAYEEIIAPLVKAVQELSQQNASLQARIEVLEGG